MINLSNTHDHSSERGRILVLGGAGLVGAPIVRFLDDAGIPVRVASRHAAEAQAQLGPRVELVAADATRADDVERAMAGCRAVLICVSDLLDPYLDVRVTREVVKLARGAHVERVGLISGASVAPERRAFPMIDAKVQAEELLQASGLPWFVLRLTWPMESLARFVQGKRASIIGHQPALIHPVAGADVGRMVSRAFDVDEAVGRTFTVHGPTAYTMKSWLDAYCALVHPGVHATNAPFWLVAAMATVTRDRNLRAAVELMKYFDGLPEFGDPAEANRVLGAPTLTLEQWVARLPTGKATARAA